MQLIRLFNTVKYLKPVQIYGRLSFWFKRRFAGPSKPGYEPGAARELKRLYPFKGNSEFSLELLNESRNFKTEEMKWTSKDWEPEAVPDKLWLYNLNYFSWLFNKEAFLSKELALHLIFDWIEKNSDPGSESWEPYPLCKRIVNWCIWLDQYSDLVGPIQDCIVSSIQSQSRRLMTDLEYHNQANHLFENLAALLIASLFLLRKDTNKPQTNGKQAKSAAQELSQQIDEQFFADGGHYERSPMYHKEMLEALKKVAESISQAQHIEFIKDTSLEVTLKELKDKINAKLPLFNDWLANLTHPDGKIALFNDSTLKAGIVKKDSHKEKPLNYLLEDSGFFVRRDKNDYFVLSCKEPSPAHQPGHTHCDICSFELSINGQRCIVDTGCGSYQNTQIRQHCRSSSSHNISLIEHSEQSDIWGSFRIGKRAKIENLYFDSDKSLLTIEIKDQFMQRIRREIIFSSNRIKVRDRLYDRRITGTFCSLLHLHPDCMILPSSEPGNIHLTCKRAEFFITTGNKMRSVIHSWYPDFSREIRSEKLIISNHQTEAIDYVISW
ncbi:MAG: heparinase II/III domain-containing protein [Candidatus Rifleibacteriota bacterium]